ncbi:Trans-2-enoyl-CoA reductase, mitochondrial [Hypsibius exemplaris]|uniref:Enoyl-[acyl-carrier-protein] reductase, mitochondrial n=1 Tax=Hypsibius exemplaris TaxID=2072580 RepID=A0A9X6NIR7_HYPEX|nr:Trans-2-enoyl-CoA reductase, mitochondrial [Hypsibius exemplaris]
MFVARSVLFGTRAALGRHASSWQATVVKYAEYGDPEKVLQEYHETLSQDLEAGNVALRWLAAPINPADINTIQGVYAVKPPLPAVAGNEGVAEVIKVGSAVKNVQVGDHVVPGIAAIGAWRTHSIVPAADVLKIAADLPLIEAATLTVNPCTAYRMVYDFVDLAEGDVIVQNGANSAVGQAVIQIAAHKKWKTINIIRDRPNKAETVEFLTDMGATHVITDTDFKKREVISQLPQARLGLNCVGGKAVPDMIKLMEDKSTLVTYGGMSRQPMIVPTTAMIFKDMILAGFWITRWNKSNSVEDRTKMLDDVVTLMKKKVLKPPVYEPVMLKDYQQAVKRAQEGFSGSKQIFVMDDHSFSKITQELKALGVSAAPKR